MVIVRALASLIFVVAHKFADVPAVVLSMAPGTATESESAHAPAVAGAVGIGHMSCPWMLLQLLVPAAVPGSASKMATGSVSEPAPSVAAAVGIGCAPCPAT